MTKTITTRFPAILIGGPPHTGKSVLSRSLKAALKAAGVQHYRLPAAPDGEGDWFHDIPAELAQALRRKGVYTTTWVERVRRDIAYRPLPFLVDVGGRPELWQETIFDQCTHAILLIKDAESEAEWQAKMDNHNVPVIAVLTSSLDNPSIIINAGPVLRGTMTGLHRGSRADGPVFEALAARVKALFNYGYEELLDLHQQRAPTDLVIDLRQLAQQLYPDQTNRDWQPQDLSDIFNYLPRGTTLGLYGIGPGWLYAAIARYIYPAPFFQFDARLGWTTPLTLPFAQAKNDILLPSQQWQRTDHLHLAFFLPQDYLDYEETKALAAPVVSFDQGLVLSGKLPLWLLTGLALTYRDASWVAIYQPQVGAVVISSNLPAFSPGDVLDSPPGD